MVKRLQGVKSGHSESLNMRLLFESLFPDLLELFCLFHSECYFSPYFFISLSNPLLPSWVCLGPRIPRNVPSGNEALLLGTTVTRVVSPYFLVRAVPCLAFLPSTQSSDVNSLISCLPDTAGRFPIRRKWVAASPGRKV